MNCANTKGEFLLVKIWTKLIFLYWLNKLAVGVLVGTLSRKQRVENWAKITHGMTSRHPYKQAGFPLCVCMMPFSCAPNTWWEIQQVGVESESRANGFFWEFLEQMEFQGNLVWRTFSKHRWIFAKWESKRSEIPQSKASKSMDQRFHWLKCWHTQCQFQYLWRKGILNCADYSSKHHAPKHHQNTHPFFVFDNTEFPEQWWHTLPQHSWYHISYLVSTPWSTVLNNSTGYFFHTGRSLQHSHNHEISATLLNWLFHKIHTPGWHSNSHSSSTY